MISVSYFYPYEELMSKSNINHLRRNVIEAPKVFSSGAFKGQLIGKEVLKNAKSKLNKTKTKKKINHIGIILTNLIIIVLIGFFIALNNSNIGVGSTLNSTADSSLNPLDQVSSANIALTVANVTNLPEATAISNQAESQNAELAMSTTSGNIVAKPQVTSTALNSRSNIFKYTVQPGDTLQSLATKFGITSNSIIWSNNLNVFSTLTPGEQLIIPPINGIVASVQPGDTIASLASKYGVSQAQLIAYNDAEVSGIRSGEQILIPNGTLPSYQNYVWSGPSYSYNGYDYGYCTWYVASQIRVPDNWGNAATWSYYAPLSGWNVSSVPSVGAIAQTPYAAGGQGHVAIVTAVNGNMIEYRDMNDPYWGRVSYHGWTSASLFPNYITP